MFTIQLKRLGKKKIKKIPFALEKVPTNLKELLIKCVKSEVKKYNENQEKAQLLPFLTPDEIQAQSKEGKVGLGDSYNNTLAVAKDAIENAMQGFEDGLFVVFIDDDEVKTLDQAIVVTPESTITFIRMTFLTGTYW